MVSRIYHEALKLLRRRDYTTRQLRERLERKFGEAPEEVFRELAGRRFLDDRRYAENAVARGAGRHPQRLREELLDAGVEAAIVEAALAGYQGPSLRSVLKARMADWRLRAPLQRREAARLFRALSRLGFPEDEIREELEQLHEQH
jgi:SOS response regulatory protein OraA/RecX